MTVNALVFFNFFLAKEFYTQFYQTSVLSLCYSVLKRWQETGVWNSLCAVKFQRWLTNLSVNIVSLHLQVKPWQISLSQGQPSSTDCSADVLLYIQLAHFWELPATLQPTYAFAPPFLLFFSGTSVVMHPCSVCVGFLLLLSLIMYANGRKVVHKKRAKLPNTNPKTARMCQM